MSAPEFDVIIVGSGAAGTSCAQRLVGSGRRILMLDGGRLPSAGVPDVPFMEYRRTRLEQGELLFGADYQAHQEGADESPKLRVPSLRYVFEGFGDSIGLKTNGFSSPGSLAVGGMTNVWGGGVACFTEADLSGWPIGRGELDASYRDVIRRIGVSGSAEDDLRDFFGWDDDLQAPMPLADGSERLLRRYEQRAERTRRFRLGRARNAILSKDLAGRRACDQSGWCLWGCSHRSIYSARYELESLSGHSNFTHRPGQVVRELSRSGDGWAVRGHDLAGAPFEFAAKRVALACGPLGSAKLVLQTLKMFDQEIPFSSCPSAAFAVMLPTLWGTSLPERLFASAQLSVVLEAEDFPGPIFGNVFAPAALPVSEFIARSPLPPRSSIAFFRAAVPALLVGNLFLPGALSAHRLTVTPDGKAQVKWAFDPRLNAGIWTSLRRALSRSFGALGAFLLPGGLKPASPGSDLHYAGTVPMKATPARHQANANGEVEGLRGVYVVDAAALPSLPAKAHTLTVMANADRVGGVIAEAIASTS